MDIFGHVEYLAFRNQPYTSHNVPLTLYPDSRMSTALDDTGHESMVTVEDGSASACPRKVYREEVKAVDVQGDDLFDDRRTMLEEYPLMGTLAMGFLDGTDVGNFQTTFRRARDSLVGAEIDLRDHPYRLADLPRLKANALRHRYSVTALTIMVEEHSHHHRVHGFPHLRYLRVRVSPISPADSIVSLPILGKDMCPLTVEIVGKGCWICNDSRCAHACTWGSTCLVSGFNSYLSPKLTELSVSHCGGLNDISALARCSELTSLKIAGLCSASLSVLSSCPCLTILVLSGCRHLKDLDALGDCRQLVSFRLLRGQGTTPLPSLVRCTSLTTVELDGCSSMVGLSVLENCTGLTTLVLSRCAMLTDVSALSTCGNLCNLTVEDAPMLSNLFSLDGCRNLSKVFLRACPHVGDISIFAQCLSLQILEIQDCGVEGGVWTRPPCGQ